MKILVSLGVFSFLSFSVSSILYAQESKKILVCGLSLEETRTDDHEVVKSMNEKIAATIKENSGSQFAGLEIKDGELCARIQLPPPPPKMGEPGFDWEAYYEQAQSIGRSLGGNH